MANCKDIVNYNGLTRFVFTFISGFLDEQKLKEKNKERIGKEKRQWENMTYKLRNEIGKEETSQIKTKKWEDMTGSLREKIGTEESPNFKKDKKNK